MVATENRVPGEIFSHSPLTDFILKAHISMMMNEEKSELSSRPRLRVALSIWGPETEGSARLLEILTGYMSPAWWEQQAEPVREFILREMKRIDGGRGIIADWLASISTMQGGKIPEIPHPWKSSFTNGMEIQRAVLRNIKSLLKSAENGKRDKNRVKELILVKLMEKDSLSDVSDVVWEVLTEIGQGEWEGNALADEIFVEALEKLRQCRLWERVWIRGKVAKVLMARMSHVWKQGGEVPELEGLWLEILDSEKNAVAIGYMARLEKESRVANVKIPPDFSRASTEIWKKRAQDQNLEVRGGAWELLSALGEETGEFLVECLEKENAVDIIEKMADWEPPVGKPLPPGFWEKWIDCFQRFEQNAISGISDRPFGQGGSLDWVITTTTSKISKNFWQKWFQECQPGNGRDNELDGLRTLWEVVDRVRNVMVNSRKISKGSSSLEKSLRKWRLLFLINEHPEIFRRGLSRCGEAGREAGDYLIAGFHDGSIRPRTPNARQNFRMLAVSFVHWQWHVTTKTPRMAVDMCLRLLDEEADSYRWEEVATEEFPRDEAKSGANQQKTYVPPYFNSRLGFRMALLDELELHDNYLAECILWREAVFAAGKMDGWVTGRRELDSAGEMRWLQQFIRVRERCRQWREMDKGGEMEEVENEICCVPSPEQERTVNKVAVPAEMPELSGRKPVFCHPHRPGFGAGSGLACETGGRKMSTELAPDWEGSPAVPGKLSRPEL